MLALVVEGPVALRLGAGDGAAEAQRPVLPLLFLKQVFQEPIE